MKKTDEHIVKVKEAKPRDSGRGIARIDQQILDKLHIIPGDAVTLTGKNKTACIAWPGYPEDTNKGTIRIDGTIRKNAGVGIDDRITIRKTTVTPAQKLTLAPTEELRLIGGEEYLSQILEGRIITRGDLIELTVMGRKIDLVVTKLSSKTESAIIKQKTTVNISDKPTKPEDQRIPKISYEDIGGLNDEIKQVREMIELPLKHPELFEKVGIEPPKGVLLHGPPGTGKTLIAKAVAHESNANFFTLSGPEVISKYYGQSEENLRNIFKEAIENAPSIIFIDEIDSIAPKRGETQGDVERRVVAQLLANMDGLNERGKVIVIGATNRVNSLDPAIRRPGRFDREIEIGIPNRKGRKEILEIHTRGMPLSENINLDKYSEITHGYSGADLQALSKEAAMRTLRKIVPDVDLELESIPAEILNKLEVIDDDFYEAFKSLTPTALREVVIESPNVNWNDIGGLSNSKQELQESVEWPMKYQDVFQHMDAHPPKGILLYGPPGTGKTLLARAVASESEANFINVKGPEFMNKWVGESEKAIRETFRKARQAAPCVVFFDELDAIAPTRGESCGSSHVTERMISQLLTELDGLESLKDVIVIAATNRPDIIDSALLRPGRFDKLISIPTPDTKARKEIFKIHTKHKPLADNINLTKLAEDSKGYTGADIEAICNEAVMASIREYIATGNPLDKKHLDKLKVQKKHFDKAMNKVKAMPKEKLEKYTTIAKAFAE